MGCTSSQSAARAFWAEPVGYDNRAVSNRFSHVECQPEARTSAVRLGIRVAASRQDTDTKSFGAAGDGLW